MKHYTAQVEVSKRGNPSVDEVDTIMDRLAGYPVSLSVTPRGNRAARITLPADNLAAASTAALFAVTHGYGLGIDGAVHLEIMSEDEADLRDTRLEVPDLIGVTEAAKELGFSVQRVRQMISEGKLPAHRVGDRSYALVRSDVEAYAENHPSVIPGLGSVVREKGLDLRDVVGDPMLSQKHIYAWTNSIGEQFESEELPPAEVENAEQQIVRRYVFRVAGTHKGGRVIMDNGNATTSFDVTREGDWKPLD